MVPVLQLRQSAAENGRHRVDLTLTGLGAPMTAASTVPFALTDDDRERVRWYLEDYLEYPLDPAPKIAASVENRLVQLGHELFRAVFASDSAQRLWVRIGEHVRDLRVEITSEVADATALPWELLRDPTTDQPLALQAASFVRTHHNPGNPTTLPGLESGARLRVLLVICRPEAGADVPFRSVAGRLVGADAERPDHERLNVDRLDLDVLRPPTFARLTSVLEAAAAAGRPYHVVHFDGHGTYVDRSRAGGGGGGVSQHRYDRTGRHGYLLFEDAAGIDNRDLVGGPELGALLARNRVPVLVLNACRSAYAEAPTEPVSAEPSPVVPSPVVPSPAVPSPAVPSPAVPLDDAHGRIRAYGSLALEVADAGVPGVVAMRYSVYVVTAAQFVADLYGQLLAGRSLGDAVGAARRQLEAQPLRSIAFDPRPLQDWSVPVVYETVPLRLFAESGVRVEAPASHPSTAEPTTPASHPSTSDMTEGLPRPDVGFLGRDETLLALDRAFDTHRVALLHGYAGAGKTSTAAEFARWYAATGGLAFNGGAGAVLWSSLEQYQPLAGLLNEFADAAGDLDEDGAPWHALDLRARQARVLRTLRSVPVLWVWDNVEPVAGFPEGTPSAWSDAEQDELRRFLAEAARTRCRVLLTSRRDEQGWLGNLPVRVELPVMPMRERIQLTQALAVRARHRVTVVEDWRPLLRYSQGNPLAITVLVGQALREHLTSKAQIEGFVDRLRGGEVSIVDDERQGRTASLAASLSYGFAHAFTDAERAQLAVLHLFQETVDVDALVEMGGDDGVATLAGLTRETGLALLDRAAEIGLLTALGGGYYRIHPALPWFFTTLFTATYGPADGEAAAVVTHAFTAALGALGNYYMERYVSGHHEVVELLAVEEANLLHARRLALRHQRWDDVMGCMQGLRNLYEQLGRGTQWERLVDELVPDLTSADDGPHPGREDYWTVFTEYRVQLAQERRDYDTALRLQTRLVTWDRNRAEAALTLPDGQLAGIHRNRVRSLAVSLGTLGSVLRELGDPDCLPAYEEAAELFRRVGARTEEGAAAFNIAAAYLDIAELRDLDQAERWYQLDLDLAEPYDNIGRAKTIGQLGNVAYERFLDGRVAGEPDDVRLAHLNTAARYYHEALDLTPANNPNDRGIYHNQLGNIYLFGGHFGTALHHYQQAITHAERTGNTYLAAARLFNAALTLQSAGRVDDAVHYAHAALRAYQSLTPAPTDKIAKTQRFVAELEESSRRDGRRSTDG